ncbi:MAG: hypothetical protein AB7U20_17135, partial [Planctomycetaceae bacterium]
MFVLQKCTRCGHEFYADAASEARRCPRCHARNGDPQGAVSPDYSWHWAERGLLVVRVVGAEGPPPQCVMIGGRVRGGRRR